jgi:hypothetical protein
MCLPRKELGLRDGTQGKKMRKRERKLMGKTRRFFVGWVSPTFIEWDEGEKRLPMINKRTLSFLKCPQPNKRMGLLT